MFRPEDGELFIDGSAFRAKYPDVAPGILWRFLLGRKGVVEKAQAMFEEHLVWKAAHIPVDFRSCRDELEKNMADEPPAAGAQMQAGVTWDRVPMPDPA